MALFDSHAHLPYDETLDGVLDRAAAAGITAILNVLCDLKSLQKGVDLPQKKRGVHLFYAAGFHPHETETDEGEVFQLVTDACRQKRLVAIGEVGLDYHYKNVSKDVQQAVLRKYLRLAKKESLPLIIHCRDAYEDFFSIFDEEFKGVKPPPGVLHCFTGTQKEAEEGLQRGFYISFSGIITFEKAAQLRAVASSTDVHRILIETDSPYLAPVPYRGKKNEPAYVVEVARVVAELKKMSLDAFAAQTFQNTKELFSLSV